MLQGKRRVRYRPHSHYGTLKYFSSKMWLKEIYISRISFSTVSCYKQVSKYLVLGIYFWYIAVPVFWQFLKFWVTTTLHTGFLSTWVPGKTFLCLKNGERYLLSFPLIGYLWNAEMTSVSTYILLGLYTNRVKRCL